MVLGLCLALAAVTVCLLLLSVLAVWLSSGLRSAIAFGFVINWPPYDKTDLARPSPSWLLLATRLLGVAGSETLGAFEGLANAEPLAIKGPNGVVSGLQLKPPAAKKQTVIYLHGQAGNVAVPHRVALYKLLASRLGCEVIAIDCCSCGYSDFCWPSEAGWQEPNKTWLERLCLSSSRPA